MHKSMRKRTCGDGWEQRTTAPSEVDRLAGVILRVAVRAALGPVGCAAWCAVACGCMDLGKYHLDETRDAGGSSLSGSVDAEADGGSHAPRGSTNDGAADASRSGEADPQEDASRMEADGERRALTAEGGDDAASKDITANANGAAGAGGSPAPERDADRGGGSGLGGADAGRHDGTEASVEDDAGRDGGLPQVTSVPLLCSKLDDPVGGYVVISASTIGAAASYKCQAGRTLSRETTRTCEANGEWNGAAPTCDPVDCGKPSSPANGKVTAEATTYQATARYACDTGHYLAGATSRQCQVNGTWNETVPTCTFVDCGAPLAPANGTVSTTATTYAGTATYDCSVGSTLTGGATRTCQSSGAWSGAAPTCVLKDCGTLPNPSNGTVTTTATTYAGTATYACSNGYILSGTSSRKCDAGGTWSGTAPTCTRPASCAGGGTGAGFNCGAAGTDDCCASPLVEGGKFNRDNNTSYPATVSSFRLDKYEITVGRFRAFVTAAMGTQASPPASGSGANPNVAGSGWDAAWNTNLKATTSELTSSSGVQCDSTYQTWTGSDDKRPMNCITWYEAFAFCIWDGGRLPTELEWNYAAAGGSSQNAYPWGSTAPSTNTALAVYGCYFGGGAGSCTGVANIAPVGSVVAGNGKWGQADLAGNVWEWNLDWYAGSYPASCTNCANISSASYRVLRGGSFDDVASTLLSSYRNSYTPSSPRLQHRRSVLEDSLAGNDSGTNIA